MRLIARRAAQALPVVILATFMVYGLIRLVPGDLATTLAGEYASTERIAEIRHSYGLDRPFLVQYGAWLMNAMHGDLSRSMLSGQPVLQAILERMPNTLLVVCCATLISLALGVPLGALAATRAGSLADQVITAIASVGIALPSFWLGMVLVAWFALEFHWFPATGAAPLLADPLGAIRHAALPAIALGAGGMAEVARQVRSALADVLGSQFVRTLRAKGLPSRAIIWKHGLKNISVTLLTVVGLLINRMLGATVVIEAVFALPGLGSLVTKAALAKDFPVVQGVVLVMVMLVILTNTLIDILYAVLDPRVAR